ncbi:zinc finger transcription factor ace1 [Apiospora phragmitis]|uniref:Zinc finger transcription factor ace1 n=1 Tax=Apiospora phragmitis TaxID=2905665 RepID=A0ABR1X528_9PEZI
MLIQPEPSSGIASQASLCLTKFQLITDIAAQDTKLWVAAPGIEDQNARLRVYIKNMGADREGKSKSSLEYRLWDSLNIRIRVMKLLASLVELLEDEKISAESETEKLAEMEDILNHISKTITCLMRLSMVIQISAPHKRFFKGSFDTRLYEPADIKHVAEKYNKSDRELQERMGKANSYRRQYFKYREAHHHRVAHGSGPDTEGLDQIKIIHEDDASESASQTTAYDSNQLELPPIPAMHKHGPFECPFCYMIIAADGQKSWEKHLLDDVRPYLCLDAECPITEQYQTRREWIKHMQQKHWRTWLCPKGCHQKFSTSKWFRLHTLKSHPGTWRSKGWDPDFEDACSRPVAAWSKEPCPFCIDTIIDSADHYKQHVGEHQLDLARFVLPRVEYDPTQDDPTQDELAQEDPIQNSPTQDTETPQAPVPITPEVSSHSSVAGPSSDQISRPEDKLGKRHGGTGSRGGIHIGLSTHSKGKKSSSKAQNHYLRWNCSKCGCGNNSAALDIICPFCRRARGPNDGTYPVTP